MPSGVCGNCGAAVVVLLTLLFCSADVMIIIISLHTETCDVNMAAAAVTFSTAQKWRPTAGSHSLLYEIQHRALYKLSDYLMPFDGFNLHTADRLLWGFRLPVHYLECVAQSNAVVPFSAKSSWTLLILLHCTVMLLAAKWQYLNDWH